MSTRVHPRHLRKALDLLEAEPERAWTASRLAAACGVARRTLQKHFRLFVGCSPLRYLREVRLDRVHRELLGGKADATVTEIATRCGFNHLGRFAQCYRARYQETPSATLLRCRNQRGSALPPLDAPVEAEPPALENH